MHGKGARRGERRSASKETNVTNDHDDGDTRLTEQVVASFDGAPNLHATIVRRIVLDRFVVDHEHVTGTPEGPFDAIAALRCATT